jgi:hypothetical protein
MTTHARVRIGHCSPDAPAVDVWIDGERAIENVAFGTIGDYADLSSGRHDVALSATGADTPVFETSVDIEGETTYTVLATGLLDDLDLTIVVDDPQTVPEGMAHVRFVHCAPDAPAVDVQVAGGPTLFEGIGFREASDYVAVDAGDYEVEVVPTGNDDPALAPLLSFERGTAVSAIATGQVADGSLSALLVEDARPVMRAD